MATKRKSAEPETVRVKPSRKLSPLEYVPGVPAEGIDMPLAEAAPLLEAGVVTRVAPLKPKPPATPAGKES
jgi:hypothetical protein